MPSIEVALIVVTLAGAVYPLTGRTLSRPLRYFYLTAAVIVLVAQLVQIGPHWQILPAYAALLLIAVIVWRHEQGKRRWFQLLALLADALCLFTFAALWILPMFSLPQPTGAHPVGTTGPLSWVDHSRNMAGEPAAEGRRRELVLQIWYPAAPGSQWGEKARYTRLREVSLGRSYLAAIRTNSILNAPIADDGAPYPVLLFGPRWGGARTQNTFLCEDLASHGFVVVAVDHPLNAARVQLADGSVIRSDRADALNNLEASSAPAIEAIWNKELDIWAADDRFVLDKLQHNDIGWFHGRLDLTHVGAVGHSFGGAASLRLLGLDPRVQSAVNLDGWTFQGLEHRTSEPILLVYEGIGQVRGPQTGVEGALNTDDFAAIDGSLQRFGGLRAFVAGTQHLDFTDQTLFSPLRSLTFTGPIQGERIRAITRGLVLGFFDQTLKGQGQVPEFPEVKLERWPAN